MRLEHEQDMLNKKLTGLKEGSKHKHGKMKEILVTEREKNKKVATASMESLKEGADAEMKRLSQLNESQKEIYEKEKNDDILAASTI